MVRVKERGAERAQTTAYSGNMRAIGFHARNGFASTPVTLETVLWACVPRRGPPHGDAAAGHCVRDCQAQASSLQGRGVDGRAGHPRLAARPRVPGGTTPGPPDGDTCLKCRTSGRPRAHPRRTRPRRAVRSPQSPRTAPGSRRSRHTPACKIPSRSPAHPSMSRPSAELFSHPGTPSYGPPQRPGNPAAGRPRAPADPPPPPSAGAGPGHSRPDRTKGDLNWHYLVGLSFRVGRILLLISMLIAGPVSWHL